MNLKIHLMRKKEKYFKTIEKRKELKLTHFILTAKYNTNVGGKLQ